MTPEEIRLEQAQERLRLQKQQLMASAFQQPQQRFADIQTQAPNLRSGLLADDAYATAVSQNVGNIDISPYASKIGLDFEELDNEYNAYQSLYRNVNRLNVDEDIVNKELEKYKIGDNITQNRFAINEVRSKASKFRQDLDSNRSAIGAAQNAYKARAAAEEDLMAAVEKGEKNGGINIATARALLNEYDEQYKENNGILGRNEDGTPRTESADNLYQTYNYGKYAAYANEDEIMNEALKGINYQGNSYAVADSSPIQREGMGGLWIRATSSSGSEEYIPYAEVEDMLQTTLKNNPFYQDWIKQDAMLKARNTNEAQIAYMKSNDFKTDAYLIAQRAGLQVDEKGNITGNNDTSSLSKNEAAFRYKQAMAQAEQFDNAVAIFQETLANGATEREALEASGLPQMSKQQKEQTLMEQQIKETVRRGTNKTAFSRTKSDKDVQDKFYDLATAGLAQAELNQYNANTTREFIMNNPNLINAEPVPDFTDAGFFSQLKGEALPSSFADFLEKDGYTSEFDFRNAITGAKNNKYTKDGKTYSIDPRDSNYSKELAEKEKQYNNLKKEGSYEERIDYYIKSDKAKTTFGKGTLEEMKQSLKEAGFIGKELAKQLQIKANQLLQSQQTSKVNVTTFRGKQQQDAAAHYVGSPGSPGVMFSDRAVFFADKGNSETEMSITQAATNAGYNLQDPKDYEEFFSKVRYEGLTDGGNVIGSGGYAVTIIPKQKKSEDGRYTGGEPITLFSKTDNVERSQHHANLHKATRGLYSLNEPQSEVVIAKNAKGEEVAYYNNFYNEWKTTDENGIVRYSYNPINKNSVASARAAYPTIIAKGKELEKYKNKDGSINYDALSKNVKDIIPLKGLINEDFRNKSFIANPKYKAGNGENMFIFLGNKPEDVLSNQRAETIVTDNNQSYNQTTNTTANGYGKVGIVK